MVGDSSSHIAPACFRVLGQGGSKFCRGLDGACSTHKGVRTRNGVVNRSKFSIANRFDINRFVVVLVFFAQSLRDCLHAMCQYA